MVMSTKLKNILSEINWEGKEVELGKVYTFKDTPPFKTPTQLKEESEEQDHEVGMGMSSLKTSVRSARVIYDEIKKRDLQELDGWVQEKLTLASDYLKTVAEFMQDLDEYEKDGNTDS
jgi:hypothetical protein|tara:strand:+ start:99 stop:452 length:354 start_codon:yes stop_codon:yes gene_type:complete